MSGLGNVIYINPAKLCFSCWLVAHKVSIASSSGIAFQTIIGKCEQYDRKRERCRATLIQFETLYLSAHTYRTAKYCVNSSSVSPCL